MYVDINKLEVDTQNSMKKVIDYLEKAITASNIKDIPIGYKYISELLQMPKDITEIKTKVETARKTLVAQIESFKGAESKNNSLASQLGTEVKNTIVDTNTKEIIAQYLGKIGTTLTSANTLIYFTTDSGEKIYVGTTAYENALKNKIKLNVVQSAEYTEIQQHLMKEYGFKNETEVRKLLFIMGSNSEMASYATAIEKISNKVKNSNLLAEDFAKQMGYSLYKTQNGEQVLNVEMIYTDLFVNMNSNLFEKDSNGKMTIKPNTITLDANGIATLKEGVTIKSMPSTISGLSKVELESIKQYSMLLQ